MNVCRWGMVFLYIFGVFLILYKHCNSPLSICSHIFVCIHAKPKCIFSFVIFCTKTIFIGMHLCVGVSLHVCMLIFQSVARIWPQGCFGGIRDYFLPGKRISGAQGTAWPGLIFCQQPWLFLSPSLSGNWDPTLSCAPGS